MRTSNLPEMSQLSPEYQSCSSVCAAGPVARQSLVYNFRLASAGSVSRKTIWILLATLVLSCSTGTADAIIYTAPSRALSEVEALENAITQSDLVVVGTVSKSRAYVNKKGHIDLGYAPSEVTVDADEIKFGNRSLSRMVVQDGTQSLSATLSSRGIRGGDTVLMFLRAPKSGTAPELVLRGDDTLQVMHPVDSPFGVPGGVIKLTVDNREKLLTTIDSLNAALTLEAMTREADLVTIARITAGPDSCVQFGIKRACRTWTIKQTLKGSESRSAIPVFAVTRLPLSSPPADVILFLRAHPKGVYEIMHFRRGLLTIRDGAIERLHMPVQEALSRINSSSNLDRP